ncbi:small, acid-soluble spore protein, alpha/beta type [Paenibacillus rhizovicinus]|uniref:small, acid-soluble spore protein, alpha/beta type n=1 Tax=Paenibacillus rhizovicinus TaxID=2704463 RepID=UPI001CDD4DAE|nr:small, acid-soluble spore protein, alpha/beta type [Paenibacillus rhizovicinus]
MLFSTKKERSRRERSKYKSLSPDGYNENLTTHNAGKIGGSITRRLVHCRAKPGRSK